MIMRFCALQTAPHLLAVLTDDEASRSDAIGNLHATELTLAVVEFLIDAEADRTLRAVLVGMLREAAR